MFPPVALTAVALAADPSRHLDVPRTSTAIDVDGVVDPAEWTGAVQVPGLRVYQPAQDAADTEVQAWITQDSRALYLAFTVTTSRPLDSALLPRDETTYQDWVGVSLDTFHDGKRAYTFRVAPRGVQADGVYVDGADVWNLDTSWDDVWDSAGRVTDTGYTVELAIPFRSLRYGPDSEQVWGVILTHFVPNPWTVNTWPTLSPDEASFLGQAATLRVHPPRPRGVRLELNPTLTAGWGGPGTPVSPDPGLGVRWGVTSGITADIAVNPDFSQIEADADQVVANTKFPLAYAEKRPFFLEGADFFETPLSPLYTRSIVDPLGGVKVSGRVGKTGLGVVSAWDLAPTASTIQVDYAEGVLLPGWDPATVDGARALDTVGRLRLDVGKGGGVGFFVSDKELVRADGGVLGNHVVGGDVRLVHGDHVVSEGQVLASTTDLPDGGTLTGAAWTASASGNDDAWAWTLHHSATTPGFRAENGFLQEVDRMVFFGQGFRHVRGKGLLRSAELGADAAAAIDFDGTLVGARGGPNLHGFVGQKLFQQVQLFAIHERFFTKTFDRWTFNGATSLPLNPHLAFGLAWDVGPEPHYDAATLDDLYLGWNQTVTGEVAISAFERLTAVWSTTGAQFKTGLSGEVVYPTWINRLWVNVNVTRPFSVRWIEEWNTADGSLDSSALLAYEVHPGTAAWLGWSQTLDVDTVSVLDQQLFAKVSYLWRV